LLLILFNNYYAVVNVLSTISDSRYSPAKPKAFADGYKGSLSKLEARVNNFFNFFQFFCHFTPISAHFRDTLPSVSHVFGTKMETHDGTNMPSWYIWTNLPLWVQE